MIKNIYGKHTFYFSALTIVISIIALITRNNFEFSNDLLISSICLFFILSIGISHGAMDNYKANKLLIIYKINNKSIFFIIYILIATFVIILWSLYSSFTLLLFLLVASYHFGREDTSFLNKGNSNLDQFFYLIKGSLIIFSPLFFHFDQTLKIFETLFLSEKILIYLKDEHWIINFFLGLSILSYFYFVYKNKFKDFCFLHSIRHIISISNQLEPSNFLFGIKTFIKKAFPLTVVTAVLYLLAIFFLSNSYGLNEVVIKVIFIGLASLTFPHILLEYLLEKNEKRN